MGICHSIKNKKQIKPQQAAKQPHKRFSLNVETSIVKKIRRSVPNNLAEVQLTYFNAKFNEAKNVGDLKAENPFKSDFKPIKRLGEGGFGKVVLAKRRSNDTERAIKIISKHDYVGNQYKREVNILKELNHPNVLRYYGSYEHGSRVYLVTEFCDGKELLADIVQKGQVTEKQAQGYFIEIFQALCYLHSRNIVHRDLKPENILIENETKRVKVIDFGLSKKTRRRNSKMRSEVGTWYYSSPEVDEGYYTEKCDIWSVGVILYLTFSGQLPFYASSTKELLKLKKTKDLDFKGHRWTRVSSKAKDLIASCLCKKEKHRISSLDALAHPWLNDKPNDEVILDHGLVGALYSYSKECRLINNIKYFVCSFYDYDKKEKELIDLFKLIDTDKNGEISRAEFKDAFGDNLGVFRAYNLDIEDVDTLFDHIDLDCSGGIDFLEFLFAVKNYSDTFTRESLKSAFVELANENAFIDIKSLGRALGANIPANEWALVLDNYDKNKDKKIDFEEFLNIFKVKK